MNMLVYDATVDAAYLSLTRSAASHAVRQVRLDVSTTADYDATGRLIGLEFLDASQRFTSAQLASAASAIEWLTLKEASLEFGLAPSTMRVQIRAGKLPSEKRGRDQYVARHELLNYLERRDSARTSSSVGVVAESVVRPRRMKKKAK